ncbi:hypothetical protein C809_03665 [Lachnospiraceae bacterium MD335]|jgi:hypothetical protein|nr:hypothetical protein C809_03665 [Lachnospiraceae bacterium MD335]
MECKECKKGYERGGNSLGILLNSKLDCKNCIFVYSPDDNTGACAVFTLKPNKVLDGGKCDKKLTEDDL